MKTIRIDAHVAPGIRQTAQFSVGDTEVVARELAEWMKRAEDGESLIISVTDRRDAGDDEQD